MKAYLQGDLQDGFICLQQQFRRPVHPDIAKKLRKAHLHLIEEDAVELPGGHMEFFTDRPGMEILAVVPVYVGDKGVKLPSVPDMTDIAHLLIGIAESICVHADPGQKYLADMGAVHKSQDFCQFLQREVRIEQVVDRLSDAHLVEQIKERQPCGTGDIRTDGRFAHKKDL